MKAWWNSDISGFYVFPGTKNVDLQFDSRFPDRCICCIREVNMENEKFGEVVSNNSFKHLKCAKRPRPLFHGISF